MFHALQTLLLLIFPVLVIVAGLRDAATYTIPNWISVALAVAFPFAAVALDLPMHTILVQLGVGALALVAGIAMYSVKWIGGGDAKLFAAAALWIGWPSTVLFLGMTGVAGGVLAVTLLGLRSAMVRPFMPAGPGWFARLVEPGQKVPYGMAIAAGALMAFPHAALLDHY